MSSGVGKIYSDNELGPSNGEEGQELPDHEKERLAALEERRLYEEEMRDHGNNTSATSYGRMVRHSTGQRQEAAAFALQRARMYTNALAGGAIGASVSKNAAQQLFDNVMDTAGTYLDRGRDFIVNGYNSLTDRFNDLVEDAGNFFSNRIAQPLEQRVEAVGDTLTSWKDGALNFAGDLREDFGNTIQGTIQGAQNFAGDIMSDVGDAASNVYEGSWLQSGVDTLSNGVQNVRDVLPEVKMPDLSGLRPSRDIFGNPFDGLSIRGLFGNASQGDQAQAYDTPEISSPTSPGSDPELNASI